MVNTDEAVRLYHTLQPEKKVKYGAHVYEEAARMGASAR